MALIGEARALLINGDTGVHTKTQLTSEELAAWRAPCSEATASADRAAGARPHRYEVGNALLHGRLGVAAERVAEVLEALETVGASIAPSADDLGERGLPKSTN